MAYEMLQGTRAPVRMWADPASVEPDALEQLRNVASLPWTRHVAVMPDVHFGKGATVGSVIAMQRRRLRRPRSASTSAAAWARCGPSSPPPICPTTCAGCAPRSRRRSRSGFDAHDDPVDPVGRRGLTARLGRLLGAVRRPAPDGAGAARAGRRQQLGTLGGGNHFIELCLDDATTASG